MNDQNNLPSWIRPFAILLEKILIAFDRTFDWAYSSKYNPIHRSGTLTNALLLTAIVTGCYLLVFYEISNPYVSVLKIKETHWLMGWVRNLHRYASDLAVVAVVFHTLRMLVEKKTWGPRVLAWVSGAALCGVLLISGWTGFVLVWDRQGQKVAEAGARLMDVLPIFSESLVRTFLSGDVPGESFFFTNLFLHVALPLMMIAGLWLHTSKLARSVWFPERRVLFGVLGVLIVLSFAFPAGLASRPDALSLDSRFLIDGFYNGWIPLIHPVPAWVGLSLWTVFFGILTFFFPVFWKPKNELAPQPSKNDPLRCEGCERCVQDCPFEAISMVPGPEGNKKTQKVAQVNPALCVSCGLCAGSCTQFAIGPQGRSGLDQIHYFVEMKKQNSADRDVMIFCKSQAGAESLAKAVAQKRNMIPFAIDCVGSLHTAGVTSLLSHFKGVYIWGCPEQVCRTREGTALARARFLEGQEPALPARTDKSRVRLVEYSILEQKLLEKDLDLFLKHDGSLDHRQGWTAGLRAFIFTLLISAAFLFFSSFEVGSHSGNVSSLRLGWRLAGQTVKTCRKLTEDELRTRPKHMITANHEECVSHGLVYKLIVKVNGDTRISQSEHPQGRREDGPLAVSMDLQMTPGEHQIEVDFSPENAPADVGVRLHWSERVRFESGRATWLNYDPARGWVTER